MRLRIPPSGPLIKDPVSGAGPLEVGDGTPGIVWRASGIQNSANVPFVGSGTPQVPAIWQDLNLPLGTGPGLSVLPFVLTPDYLWDVDLYLCARLVNGVAATDVDVRMFGRNVTTSARTLLFGLTTVFPNINGAVLAQVLFPGLIRRRRLALPTLDTYDDIEVEVEAAAAAEANFEIVSEKCTLRVTQFALGSQ